MIHTNSLLEVASVASSCFCSVRNTHSVPSYGRVACAQQILDPVTRHSFLNQSLTYLKESLLEPRTATVGYLLKDTGYPGGDPMWAAEGIVKYWKWRLWSQGNSESLWQDFTKALLRVLQCEGW